MAGIGKNSKRFKVLKEFDKQKRLVFDMKNNNDEN